MSKKKVFGISNNLNNGFTETMNAVKNHAGVCRYEVISLSRIETDPENPRELVLTESDITNGLDKADSQYDVKKTELQNLLSLSDTINSKGIINPVVVYKFREKYRLVAGERRYLASLIAKKVDIQAKILSIQPKGLDLRLLQWIENTERAELSLKDRMGNVQAILEEFKKDNPETEITATLLKNLMSISLPQASCYLSILNAPADIKELVVTQKLTNLDKSAFIASMGSEALRKKLVEECLKGSSLKELRERVKFEEQIALKSDKPKKRGKRGRAPIRVDFGTTKNTNVVKSIITSVLAHNQFKQYSHLFENTDWGTFEATTKAFRKLVEVLEKNLG